MLGLVTLAMVPCHISTINGLQSKAPRCDGQYKKKVFRTYPGPSFLVLPLTMGSHLTKC